MAGVLSMTVPSVFSMGLDQPGTFQRAVGGAMNFPASASAMMRVMLAGRERGWMRQRSAVKVAVVAAAAACAALFASSGAAVAGTHAAAARSAVTSGAWGTAQRVRGLAALNRGGKASISSVSCVSAGNCSAGGTYTDGSGHIQAFVVGDAIGTWGKAKEVPGFAALNVGKWAWFGAVSCASAGNCTAGGAYTDGSGHRQGFVVRQTNGSWGTAKRVVGAAALNQGGISSVSCASAGNCTAVGSPSFELKGSFVVSQKNGSWGKAEHVPGLAALSVGGASGVNSVSCASAGNCSAGGRYTDGSGWQAFVVSERNGTWRKAEEVPGTAALNQFGDAQTVSVSCVSAGNCSAGGYYAGGDDLGDYGPRLPFVVTEKNGTWGTAQEVPGTIFGPDYAAITSVSCASAGNCSAGGYYLDGSDTGCCYQAFAVTQANGIWGTAEEIPGTAALDTGDNAGFNSVSCAPAGSCSAGGYYTDSSGTQAYVINGRNGTWRKAEEVPGTASLNQAGYAALSSVSCGRAGNCSAGGYYADGSGTQAFVVSETTTAGPDHR
jgi:hypothetical protein